MFLLRPFFKILLIPFKYSFNICFFISYWFMEFPSSTPQHLKQSYKYNNISSRQFNITCHSYVLCLRLFQCFKYSLPINKTFSTLRDFLFDIKLIKWPNNTNYWFHQCRFAMHIKGCLRLELLNILFVTQVKYFIYWSIERRKFDGFRHISLPFKFLSFHEWFSQSNKIHQMNTFLS